MNNCAIPECRRLYYGKGWCKIHWQRWYRTGDPLTIRPMRKIHGLHHTREYRIWSGMKSRCYNKNNPRYKDWGGNGIKVCDRWLHDFPAFIGDMGFAPSPSHSLDRKDGSKDYTPDNCRWATPSEQSYNKGIQSNNKSAYRGVYFDKQTGRWRAEIAKEGVRIKLGRFTSLEEAALIYDCAAIQLYGSEAKLNMEVVVKV